GRAAAARRDRACPEPRPEGDAVRRADVGARRRARGRGARRDAQARRDRHDDGDRHARGRLRARDRRPEHLHGRGPRGRVGLSRQPRLLRERTPPQLPGSSPMTIVGDTIYRWNTIWTYHSALLHGLVTALEVAIVALALSIVVGLLFAVLRMARPPFCWPAAI